MMGFLKNKIKSATAEEKTREVITNVISTAGIKGLSFFVTFATLPAYMKYFDNSLILGVWYTIFSLASWVLSFDLGIGNGLRNNLVFVLVENDEKRAKTLISSAYVAISLLTLLMMAFSAALVHFVDWNAFLNVSVTSIPRQDLQWSVGILLTGILLQMTLRIINSVLYALQRSSINNLLALLTSLLMLTFALVAPRLGLANSLIALAIAYLVSVNLPLLIATLTVFSFDGTLKGCGPSVKLFRLDQAKTVVNLGLSFLWAQIMFMLICNTNEYLIAQLASPEAVVEYQAYFKLTSLALSIYVLALTPLWSAVTKALGENDYRWLKKAYRVLRRSVLAIALIEILIVVSLQPLMDIWLGEGTIQINYAYGACFAFMNICQAWQSAESTVACGSGKMMTQNICYTVGIILKILLSCISVAVFSQSWIVLVVFNTLIFMVYAFIQSRVTRKQFFC